MSGIKFDSEWVGGYAELAAQSADEMGVGVDIMAARWVSDESFGPVGRTLHCAEAYGSVAGTLRDQLSRAVEALGSASTGLEQVTARYVDADESTASTIHRQH